MAAETGLLSVQRFRLKYSTPMLAVHVHQASSGTGVEKDVVFLINHSLQFKMTSSYLGILGWKESLQDTGCLSPFWQ